MQAIVNAVTKALENENYFGALFMALTIPDICASIDNPSEKHYGVRYKKWFRENLKYKYYPDNMLDLVEANQPEFFHSLPEFMQETFRSLPVGDIAFTDDMCWKLRCSVLHSGSTDTGKYSFHLTHGGSHQNIVNGVLQISVARFCKDICDAFAAWCERNKDNEDIQQRLAEGMRIQNEVSKGMHLG